VSREPESMLALDIGSAYVKAVLIDRVGDVHRFIARGTAPQMAAVNQQMSLADPVLAALHDLERLSGRRLVGGDELPIIPEELGAGVDAVAGTSGMLGVLNVAIAALRDDASLRLAEAALHSVPSNLIARITGKEIAGRGNAFEQFAEKLRDKPPHIVLLVGGTDHKPDRVLVTMAEAVAVAASLIRPQDRPALLYAGPPVLRAMVAASVADRMPVRVVDNVTPDDRDANLGPLRAELDSLYVGVLGKGRQGFDLVKRWCGGHVSSVGQALLRAYSHRGLDILAADVGASGTVLVRSAKAQVLIQADCGVGQGAWPLLERSGAAALRCWLASDPSDEAIGNWALNRQIRPWVRCTTVEECAIELAFVREALATSLEAALKAWPEGRGAYSGLAPKADMVVGGGAVMAGCRSQAEAAGAMISGLQPIGVVRLARDSGDLAPSLGALADANPAAVRSVLERDAISVLGTLVAPVGQGKTGRPAFRLEVAMPGGESVSVDVAAGSLMRVPLPSGVVARAVVRPVKPYDVVVGAPGQGLEVEVEGGPLGIIVDARGRPLPDLRRLPGRSEQLRRWAAALGG